MFFSQLFCSKLPVKITTDNGNGRFYKYCHRNWPYPYTKNNFATPPGFYTSIKPQRNSDSDDSMGENDVTLSGLYKSTNNHGNKYGKYNDNS